MARAVNPRQTGAMPGTIPRRGLAPFSALTVWIDNNALGFQVLDHNTTGNYNAAEGFRALFSNTTGGYNTANGVNALYHNTTGFYNTAAGVNALISNTTGSSNTGERRLCAQSQHHRHQQYGQWFSSALQ